MRRLALELSPVDVAVRGLLKIRCDMNFFSQGCVRALHAKHMAGLLCFALGLTACSSSPADDAPAAGAGGAGVGDGSSKAGGSGASSTSSPEKNQWKITVTGKPSPTGHRFDVNGEDIHNQAYVVQSATAAVIYVTFRIDGYTDAGGIREVLGYITWAFPGDLPKTSPLTATDSSGGSSLSQSTTPRAKGRVGVVGSSTDMNGKAQTAAGTFSISIDSAALLGEAVTINKSRYLIVHGTAHATCPGFGATPGEGGDHSGHDLLSRGAGRGELTLSYSKKPR